jgi:hypothetical protein
MSLLDLWESNRSNILGYSIWQLVQMAGDGQLRDDSNCSSELRRFFSLISSEKLASYISDCIEEPFKDSGLVLQDMVNELGRRLDFDVTPGHYRGSPSKIGNDGLWQAKNWSFVVEVKKTDAYRIDLERIAGYRNALMSQSTVGERSSTLIIVGRADTGGLEAEIRGSRHAWDMRLISIDALIKLVQVKEQSVSDNVVQQIREVLKPIEYTRVDRIIDMLFDIAEDAETEQIDPPAEENVGAEGAVTGRTHNVTPRALIESKRERVVESYGQNLRSDFVRATRTLFESADSRSRICVVVSKNYRAGGNGGYWYRFDPEWLEYIDQADSGYYVLSGIDLEVAYAVPTSVMKENLGNLNKTTRKDGSFYWHIHLYQEGSGEMLCKLREGERLALSSFEFPLIKVGAEV